LDWFYERQKHIGSGGQDRTVLEANQGRAFVIKLLRRPGNSSQIGRESGARPLLFLVAKTMMTYFGVDDYKTVTIFVKILLANHLQNILPSFHLSSGSPRIAMMHQHIWRAA
jgi:hypothetical protein